MIISHCFALVKCFFNFFEISFFELFNSLQISLALFSAQLLYHNISRLSRTFFNFFEISFSELFFSFSISFALFSARLLYHNVSRLSRTFLSFFALFRRTRLCAVALPSACIYYHTLPLLSTLF